MSMLNEEDHLGPALLTLPTLVRLEDVNPPLLLRGCSPGRYLGFARTISFAFDEG